MALSANDQLKIIKGLWVTRGFPMITGEYLLTLQKGRTKNTRFLFATRYDGRKFVIPEEMKDYKLVAWASIAPFSGKSRLHEGPEYNIKKNLLKSDPNKSPF